MPATSLGKTAILKQVYSESKVASTHFEGISKHSSILPTWWKNKTFANQVEMLAFLRLKKKKTFHIIEKNKQKNKLRQQQNLAVIKDL